MFDAAATSAVVAARAVAHEDCFVVLMIVDEVVE